MMGCCAHLFSYDLHADFVSYTLTLRTAATASTYNCTHTIDDTFFFISPHDNSYIGIIIFVVGRNISTLHRMGLLVV